MGNEAQESFQEFYTKWIGEQRQQLGHLLHASKASPAPPLPPLVARTVAHYEEYYTNKSRCASTQVLVLLSPPWTSQLEHAFIWVGGWRPTTAFHLLYSKSGLQLTARLSSAAAAAARRDLSDLSAEQMGMIDKLHRTTVSEERRISEKAAKQQERVADVDMVELSHVAGEEEEEEEEEDGGKVENALRGKEDGFQKVLKSADDLRLGTLKGVVGILSPIQAVHFLIAAGELHLSLHEWGREREERE